MRSSNLHDKMKVVRVENGVDIYKCDTCGHEFGQATLCPKCGTLIANPVDILPDPVITSLRNPDYKPDQHKHDLKNRW